MWFLRNLLTQRWMGVLLGIVVFVIGWSTVRVVMERLQLQHEIGDLQTNVQAQETQLKEYQTLLDKIKDFTYIEREARLKLALKKPGENVFVVPDALLADATPHTNGVRELTNPERWWKYFFGG